VAALGRAGSIPVLGTGKAEQGSLFGFFAGSQPSLKASADEAGSINN